MSASLENQSLNDYLANGSREDRRYDEQLAPSPFTRERAPLEWWQICELQAARDLLRITAKGRAALSAERTYSLAELAEFAESHGFADDADRCKHYVTEKGRADLARVAVKS